MPSLTQIEGIGEVYAERLAAARVGSTASLLKEGATRAGRNRLAKVTGVSRQNILKWVNRADLFRVPGVGEEYSDLLEASGVDSVPELAGRRAETLWEKLVAVNERRALVRRVPSRSQVLTWIRAAKKLPRVVHH